MSKELKALKQVRHSFERLNIQGIPTKYTAENLNIIEAELKEKEKQDTVLKVLKEVIRFGVKLPEIKPNQDNVFDVMPAVSMGIQRAIENKERELFRQWVLETCFPKEIKALETIKECFEVDNDDFLEYEGKYYFYGTDIPKEKYDLLKEVLL